MLASEVEKSFEDNIQVGSLDAEDLDVDVEEFQVSLRYSSSSSKFCVAREVDVYFLFLSLIVFFICCM